MKRLPKLVQPDPLPQIDRELRKQTKGDLIAIILAIARQHSNVVRDLENRLKVEKPAVERVADISAAIDRATDFDQRQMGHNFDIDWQTYADVKKGLSLLVKAGQLDDAKSLALKLMKQGSYQVECSDEGLMSDDICECLLPVIQAAKTAGGPGAARWAKAMLAADRVGCLCDQELAQLRDDS